MEGFEAMSEKEARVTKGQEGREVLRDNKPVEEGGDRKLSEEKLSNLRERYESFYKILDGIDFAYLKHEYAALARRSGINPDTLNFLGPDRILPYKTTRGLRGRMAGMLSSETVRGSYDVEGNVTSLDWNLLEGAHKDGGRAWLLPFHLLKVLVHEEAHAASKGVCSESETATGVEVMRQTGYERRTHEYALTVDEEDGSEGYETASIDLVFKSFNEGVVEKLSQEVLVRYVQQADDKNFDTETGKRFLAWHRENPQLKSYKSEVLLVESFISFTAAAANVPEDVVWQGVVRGLFEGSAFGTPDMQRVFEEAAGFDLIKHLSQVSSYDKEEMQTLRTDIEKRANFIKTLDEASPLKKALLQSIDHLNIFRRK